MNPNSQQPTCIARHGKTIFLAIFLFTSLCASAQICDCPLPGTCAPCRGGYSEFTLRFNSFFSSLITVSDQGGVIFNAVVGAGGTFSFSSSRPNDKFQGPTIQIRIAGSLNASIGTGCGGDIEIGDRFGSFTVVAGESKDGGAICCHESDRDDDAPDIRNCPDDRNVNLSSGDGNCTVAVRWTEPTADDDCTVASFTSDFHPGDAFPVGDTWVTYTAMDKAGNKSECKFRIRVIDNVKPQITGPGSMIVSATESCSAVVTWATPTVTDCSAVTLTSNFTSGASFPVGNHKVTYTARDARGNVSTHSFDIRVTGDTPPAFTNCPADITVQENAACESIVTWTPPTASDVCGNPVVASSHKPGAKFPIGSTRVEYTATDSKGNKAVCSFLVNVVTEATPVVTGCPPEPIRIRADERGEAEATWQEPQATVACGDVPVERSHAPGSIFNIGTTSVVYTFGQGDHTATCSFDIIVSPPDITIDIGKAVTPNGDGIHDYWEIVSLGKYKDNVVLVIDRWGNKIYEASGYDNERVLWDGRSQQGAKVPTGTYFYTVEVRVQGIVWKRKGSVEVIQP